MESTGSGGAGIPRMALIGAGIFARTQYVPRLREISHLFALKAIWSRTEASTRVVAELTKDFAHDVECKWGDSGLDDIANDSLIDGVFIVLAGQVQVDISLRMLKAGKHVLQEKPAASSTTDVQAALKSYNSLIFDLPYKPIWAVAENYRFEPAFLESRKMVNEIGDMMNIQVIVEGSMNSSNPYYTSVWRRNFVGGFILDMGVHYIAGLRMLVGSDIATVSANARHVDPDLPPPDNLCALFQLENGCAGVFVMAVNSRSPKIYWRVDGTKGAVQVERGVNNGRHGYDVLFFSGDGKCQKTFYAFSGVNEELKAFIHDISQVSSKDKIAVHEVDPRSSYEEGARDVAILEAMLESSTKQEVVRVKKF